MLVCIQPMSSPMIKRMLGFCCCCATAGMLATVTVASMANNPRQMFPATLMVPSFVCRPRRAGSLQPFSNCDPPDLREHALQIGEYRPARCHSPQPLHCAERYSHRRRAAIVLRGNSSARPSTSFLQTGAARDLMVLPAGRLFNCTD